MYIFSLEEGYSASTLTLSGALDFFVDKSRHADFHTMKKTTLEVH
jgi:hypothetical protein